MLYGKPVIDMPHIRRATASAYARLTAMKLYAYRALDYVQECKAADRRYLLFNAVQKAKVSTEGVKVMALLSECMGAKGFEAETYFEMALRDAQLIPAVEGSTHVNLGLTAQFIPRYFSRPDRTLAAPTSLVSGKGVGRENTYLMEARTGAINTVAFPPYLAAYKPLLSARNVRLFAQQVKAFRLFLIRHRPTRARPQDAEIALILGQCLATIAYGQLIAENAVCLDVATQMVSAIFHALITDLTASALLLESLPNLDLPGRVLIHRVVAVPKTPSADWDFALARMNTDCKTPKER
jgi:acyl-CoA dehydrogenase